MTDLPLDVYKKKKFHLHKWSLLALIFLISSHILFPEQTLETHGWIYFLLHTHPLRDVDVPFGVMKFGRPSAIINFNMPDIYS